MKIKVKKVGTGWSLPQFRKFQEDIKRGGERQTVVAGYRAHYAVYQHENLQYKHAPGRRAKFLERAIRENKKNLMFLIRDYLQARRDVPGMLMVAGRFILNASNVTIPLDTGFLRDSEFMRLE